MIEKDIFLKAMSESTDSDKRRALRLWEKDRGLTVYDDLDTFMANALKAERPMMYILYGIHKLNNALKVLEEEVAKDEK